MKKTSEWIAISEDMEMDFGRMKVRFTWISAGKKQDNIDFLKCDNGVWMHRKPRTDRWWVFADGCGAESIVREQILINKAYLQHTGGVS